MMKTELLSIETMCMFVCVAGEQWTAAGHWGCGHRVFQQRYIVSC